MKDSENSQIDQFSDNINGYFLDILLNSLDTTNIEMNEADYAALDNLSQHELVNSAKIIFELFNESEENYKILSNELTARILLKALKIDEPAEEKSIKSQSIEVIATLCGENNKFAGFFAELDSQQVILELLKSSNLETQEITFWAILFILEEIKTPQVKFLKDEAIKTFEGCKSELSEELKDYFKSISEEQEVVESQDQEIPQSLNYDISLLDDYDINDNEIFDVFEEEYQIDLESKKDLRDKFRKSAKEIEEEGLKIYEKDSYIAKLIAEISNLKSQVETQKSEIRKLKSKVSQLENSLQERDNKTSETKRNQPDNSVSSKHFRSLSHKKHRNIGDH